MSLSLPAITTTTCPPAPREAVEFVKLFEYDHVDAGLVDSSGATEVHRDGSLTLCKQLKGDAFLLHFRDTFEGDARQTTIISSNIVEIETEVDQDLGITTVHTDFNFEWFVADPSPFLNDEYEETARGDVGANEFIFQMPREDHDKLHDLICRREGSYFWKDSTCATNSI